MPFFSQTSFIRTPIGAVPPVNNFGLFRPGDVASATPIYRITEAEQNVPIVEVVNNFTSTHIEKWPIPRRCNPNANSSDRNLTIIDRIRGMTYNILNAVWVDDTHMTADGNVGIPLTGDGVSVPAKYRATAAGWAQILGMVLTEDFENGETDIPHGLTILPPLALIEKGAAVPPAVILPASGGEQGGLVTNGTGVPMGAHYQFPAEVDLSKLAIAPFTRMILRALQTFGGWVIDGHGAKPVNGLPVWQIRFEPGLFEQKFNATSQFLSDTLVAETAQVIGQFGMKRLS